MAGEIFISKVFISYRREDSGAEAGRLNDTLNQLLGAGSTFLDWDRIAPGKDFEKELRRALKESQVLLALMGSQWESVKNSAGRIRLFEENDFVRMELVAALQSKDVRIVPVLLNRSTVPHERDLPDDLRPITKLEAFEIRRDRWKQDIGTLLEKLDIPFDRNDQSQASRISAIVEWKRKELPDPAPRRYVVYVDNMSHAPIIVTQVTVVSETMSVDIEDWGAVVPGALSEYELEESEFNPTDDRPEVHIQFVDSQGQKWSLRKNKLRRLTH